MPHSQEAGEQKPSCWEARPGGGGETPVAQGCTASYLEVAKMGLPLVATCEEARFSLRVAGAPLLTGLVWHRQISANASGR